MFVFGPLGFVVLVLVIWWMMSAASGARRACPSCAEPVRRAASVCPHCQRDLPAGWAGGPRWFEEPTPAEREDRRRRAAEKNSLPGMLIVLGGVVVFGLFMWGVTWLQSLG